jgi:plasmid replication initiation protein
MGRQKRIEFSAPSEKIVAKANDLVRARHSFSTVEQRIFAMMIARLDRESEFPVQEVSLRRVCDLSGIDKSNIYRKADELADSLLDQSVEVRTKDEDGTREFTRLNVFSLCRHREGSGTIEAKFNDDMRDLLLELKEKFTLYLITVFLRLRSKYSTQIYELLKMRQGLRRLKMTVEEFRHSLGLENKYERFWQLRRRVIEQARGEMKEKADICFTYNVLRDGNSPRAIEFYIHENNPVVEELRESASQIRERENLVVGRSGEDARPESQGSSRPPHFDARKMFLEDLSQEEMDSLTEDRLDEIYVKARKRAEEKNPDSQSASVLAAETHVQMKKIWSEDS